ncbi:hypothetical protein L211DRAFT_840787 [Terfezia boudieri ATCC MYA-4762]|uniref:Uncharacterized protein n=1 Tax=Terfezia boudieri ATCC MYA-4762 TaxID=1051890 RepID=A0A3N4LEP3_9PEZI|nr:hypothetical protein L211DRAFT_840787 [Terfezia boudieri ATCC MYA-4762]
MPIPADMADLPPPQIESPIAIPHTPTPQPATPSAVAVPKYHFIEHRYPQDPTLPYVGQLIKIRLDAPLAGLGSTSRPLSSSRRSSTSASHAVHRSTHSAVVIGIQLDIAHQTLVFAVFPIPSYSNAPSTGIDSVTWVSCLPTPQRIKHIPMPTIASTGTPASMPIDFGAPVKPVITTDGQQADYLDRRLSWIFVEEHIVRLPFMRPWSSFSPDVHFPIEDVQRLQQYQGTMLLNSNNIVLNRVQIPDFRYPVDTDPWGFPGFPNAYLGGYGSVFHDLGYDDEDWDGDENEVDLEYSPLEFFRSIQTKDPGIRKMLEEEDTKLKQEKENGVANWIAGVYEGDD